MMIREEIHTGWKYPFVVYRPEKMEKNLPLMVMLHGAGEVGNGGEELKLVEVHGFSKMVAAGKDLPCVMVSPQCPPESFWAAELYNLYDFIQELVKYYESDEKRLYLTGLSMGGFGTWFMALRYPKLFAAIAPVCGGGMMWKTYVLEDVDIWAFHGTEDTAVYPTESINLIHHIRELGCNSHEVKLTLLDGVGHNAWEQAYQQELLDWLMSKHR